jgi:hypothetical protein
MATELIDNHKERLTRISWGGVFAGFFSGFGIWLMLSLLGAAVGASTFNPSTSEGWRDAAQGAGLWGGIAGIIAAFFGGWIASALSTSTSRGVGALHGVTVWGLTLLVSVYGAVMLLGMLGSVEAAQGMGGAVQEATPASAWGLWIASALMLIAAAVGGALGGGERKAHRALERRVTERDLAERERREVTPGRPLQPREV